VRSACPGSFLPSALTGDSGARRNSGEFLHPDTQRFERTDHALTRCFGFFAAWHFRAIGSNHCFLADFRAFFPLQPVFDLPFGIGAERVVRGGWRVAGEEERVAGEEWRVEREGGVAACSACRAFEFPLDIGSESATDEQGCTVRTGNPSASNAGKSPFDPEEGCVASGVWRVPGDGDSLGGSAGKNPFDPEEGCVASGVWRVAGEGDSLGGSAGKNPFDPEEG
jgi:hypothetical protein